MKYMYKILDKDKEGNLKTLFHGVDGTKKVPLNVWLKAKVKDVMDGTNGTVYRSGFHVLNNYENCEEYLKNFTNIENKVIVKCEVGELWKKEHSRNDGVYLTDKVKIIE